MRQNNLTESPGDFFILSPPRNHLPCPLPEKIGNSNAILASKLRQEGQNGFMFGKACPFSELGELIRH